MAENLIQGAITASLEVYCDRNDIHTDAMAPYANQQGHGPKRYCADLLAVLDRSKLLLLEVKELTQPTDGSPAELGAYDAYQHLLNWQFENLGVPLLYAYSSIGEMSYFRRTRHKQWPNTSLHTVRIAKPSCLFGDSQQQIAKEPDQEKHQSLLSWLLTPPHESDQLQDNLTALGLMGVTDLRNSNLLIICAIDNELIATPSAEFVGELLRQDPLKMFGLLDPDFDKYQYTLRRAHERVETQLEQLKSTVEILHNETDAEIVLQADSNERALPKGETLKRERKRLLPVIASRHIRTWLDERNEPQLDSAPEREEEFDPEYLRDD